MPEEQELFEVKLNATGKESLFRMVNTARFLILILVVITVMQMAMAVIQLVLYSNEYYAKFISREQRIYPYVTLLIILFTVVQVVHFWRAITDFKASSVRHDVARFNQGFSRLNLSFTYGIVSMGLNLLVVGYQLVYMINLLQKLPRSI
ncbi:MAG: hypothetical protein IPP93_16530 [Chitinophagaceae bacterium]|nr:hypothetical protein [Chitinophagaceae bacterium]MBL0333968.1 hypothetical protein [Chitinophagaceae bacterium]